MILLLHILTAFGSLGVAGAVYVKPSVAKLRLTYGLTASMLISGTYLVIKNSSHLLEACVMGLSLLAIISYATFEARQRLAEQTVEK